MLELLRGVFGITVWVVVLSDYYSLVFMPAEGVHSLMQDLILICWKSSEVGLSKVDLHKSVRLCFVGFQKLRCVSSRFNFASFSLVEIVYHLGCCLDGHFVSHDRYVVISLVICGSDVEGLPDG